LIEWLFGIQTLWQSARFVFFFAIIAALATGNYVQYQLHNGTKAQLEAALAQLENCRQIQNTIDRTQQQNYQYQSEQQNALKNYYEKMPKRPEMDTQGDTPNDGGSIVDGLRRLVPEGYPGADGKRLPSR